ncbi:MerR family transcriptional regulator [Rugamonas sp. R1(2021)]
MADQSQCSVPTIRYYEQIGLIPPAARSAGRRLYGEEDVRRLTFIRRCRDFGFSLERVKEMVSLYENGDRDCAEVRDIAQAHLDVVRHRMTELLALEKSLSQFVTSCNSVSCQGTTSDCVAIEDLSQSFKEVRRMAPATSKDETWNS